MSTTASQSVNDSCWAITDGTGGVVDRFATEDEARDALDTGEYPDDSTVAYVNEPPAWPSVIGVRNPRGTDEPALTIATVLDEHTEEYDNDCSEHFGCGCGWVGADWRAGGECMLAPSKTREQWRAHLVQVLTEALS